jgi:hypothetical protein
VASSAIGIQRQENLGNCTARKIAGLVSSMIFSPSHEGRLPAEKLLQYLRFLRASLHGRSPDHDAAFLFGGVQSFIPSLPPIGFILRVGVRYEEKRRRARKAQAKRQER